MKNRTLEYLGLGILGAAIIAGPVNLLSRYGYNSYQINNNAVVMKDYTPERLGASTPVTLKIGGFDRDKDGEIDEIREIGRFGSDSSIASWRVLPAMPRSSVYTPKDKEFQNKLEQLTE